jgi:hypothetical protein
MAGCTTGNATSEVRSFLATDAGPEDALPPNGVVDGLNAESSRQVGTQGDVAYYLAEFKDPRTGAAGVCIVLVKASAEFSNSACGSPIGMRTIGSETGGAEIIQKGDKAPNGWVRLSDFLIVNPDAKN